MGGGSSSAGASCAKPKPTLVLLSGFGGSQMSATSAGGRGCPPLHNGTVLWADLTWFFGTQMPCLAYYMGVDVDAATGRISNSSGVELFVDPGAQFGDFPKDSSLRNYYAVMFRHLQEAHGYSLARDLFYIPFDWRIGIQGLEQSGGLTAVAEGIARAVKANCGQKAIVMSHSYGAMVMAAIFQDDSFVAWREENVKGWVPIGAPFGGSAASPWMTQLSGDFFRSLPVLSSRAVPPALVAVQGPVVSTFGKGMFQFVFGWPTWGWLAARPGVFDADHVLVSTPARKYTVAQQMELLLDQGDFGGAALLEDSWARAQRFLDKGPVPGIETYCLYGTKMPTPSSLVYNETVVPRAPMGRPVSTAWVPGDGVVDLTSLRLCSKLAPADHIEEVAVPLVDHATVLAHPRGLTKLSGILNKLGVPYSGPVAQMLSRAVAGGTGIGG